MSVPETSAAAAGGSSALLQDAESNVLMLYTGGTIGMLRTAAGFAPAPGFLYDHLRTQTRFHDPEGSGIANHAHSQDAYRAWASAEHSPRLKSHKPLRSTDSTSLSNPAVDVSQVAKLLTDDTLEVMTSSGSRRLPALISPRNRAGKRIRYVIYEYDELIDSSDVGLNHWSTIALDIKRNYAKFDSFVILHGTDTMAYTASALAFMLENLGKSVILTGAQIPLSELRNDAVDNLLGAMSMARDYIIPEVSLYFHHKLYRGCRSSKSDASEFMAFTSPNLPELASTGTDVKVAWNQVLRPTALKPLNVHESLEGNVAVLSLFPGISGSFVRTIVQPPLKGLVLRTYGAGNAPQREDLLSALGDASRRGLVIVNITQCPKGATTPSYAAGQKLSVDAGVIPGLDMTVEAAYAKLCYLIGRGDLMPAQIRQLVSRPLRGELTPPMVAQYQHADDPDGRLHDLLLQTIDLNATSSQGTDTEIERGRRMTNQEVDVVHDTLLPILLAQSAGRNDGSLSRLIQKHHPIALEVLNYSDPVIRPPLHVSVQSGLLDNVNALLAAGASVHLRNDVANHSPLRLAAQLGHVKIVEALQQAGAHLSETEAQASRLDLERARASNDTAAIAAWKLTGIEELRES